MNILPLVIGMLLLFVMLFSSFVKEQSSLSILEKAYLGFGNTHRMLISKIERDRFNALPQKKAESPKEDDLEE